MEKKEYDKLKATEDSWYYISRRIFFSDILDKYLPKNANLKILDLGCGTCKNFEFLRDYGEAIGLDTSFYVLNFAPRDALKVCYSGTGLPFKNDTFDLITLFGVLEHIENEDEILKELRRVTKKNGKIMIEVPAYKFLWSQHDVAFHHKRRYTEKLLTKKLEAFGFKIKKSGYMFGTILPPVIILRIFGKIFGKKEIKSDEFEMLPAPLQKLAIMVNRIESRFVKQFYMPFGVSVFSFAEKGNNFI